MNSKSTRQRRDGVVAAASGIVANVWLGASSLYWRELGEIPPETLVAYRILLSLPTLLLAMWGAGNLHTLRKHRSLRLLILHAVAAILVATNWGTFIWASIHGHVLESGLGYLIAPCFAIFIGIVILHERISRVGVISMTVIFLAVILLIIRSGELEKIVYLTIAITWGGYACIKKITPLHALHGLFFETAFLAGLCLPVLILSNWSLRLPSTIGIYSIAILAMAGFISVFPLFLFGYAANKLPLSVMGFFQFVLPTTQLIVAVLIYRQMVSTNSLICFGIIWAALAVYLAYPFSMRLKFLNPRGL